MLRIYFVFVSIVGGVLGGYPDNSDRNDLGAQGSSGSYGYGYSGSFSGGVPPNVAIPQIDYSDFLSSYFKSMFKQHQHFIKNGGGPYSYSYASSSPNGNAVASSSIVFNQKGLQNQAQAAQGAFGHGLNTRFGSEGSYGGGSSFGAGIGGSFAGSDGGEFVFPGASGGGSFDPGSGGASAFASYGPGGVQQSASVFPENPKSPNVNTRFGGSGQPDGFHSVYTSSSSLTTNLDGKPKTIQQASTTVNDNGKITTYTAKNP